MQLTRVSAKNGRVGTPDTWTEQWTSWAIQDTRIQCTTTRRDEWQTTYRWREREAEYYRVMYTIHWALWIITDIGSCRIKRLTSTAKQLSAKCELQIEQLREKDVTIQVRRFFIDPMNPIDTDIRSSTMNCKPFSSRLRQQRKGTPNWRVRMLNCFNVGLTRWIKKLKRWMKPLNSMRRKYFDNNINMALRTR